nr:MAG TPA: hypothetical protein [Caudoviricetes sp.]
MLLSLEVSWTPDAGWIRRSPSPCAHGGEGLRRTGRGIAYKTFVTHRCILWADGMAAGPRVT